ncbi:MAG: SpoIIE family protein phosphatase [Motilibacteraceae bacterium]
MGEALERMAALHVRSASRRGGVWGRRLAPLAALVVVSVVDVALGPGKIVLGLLVIAPVLAAALLSPRVTALYGLLAFDVGIAIGQWDQQWTEAPAAQIFRVVGIAAGAVIGVVAARDRQRRELRIASAAGAMAAAERARAASERSERLLRVSTALSAAPDVDAVARAALRLAPEDLQARSATLALEDGSGELRVLAGAPGEARWERAQPPAGSALADAARTSRPTFRRGPEADGDATEASWCALPLLAGDRPLGALTLSFDTERAFDADEQAFLRAVAVQVGLAVERAELASRAEQAAARAEQANSRLALLAEVSDSLASSDDVTTALERLAAAVVPVVGDVAAVYGVDAHLLGQARELQASGAPDTATVSGKVLRRLAVAMRDPASGQVLVQRDVGFPVAGARALGEPLLSAMLTGQPGAHDLSDDGVLADWGFDERGRAFLRSMRTHSAVVAPVGTQAADEDPVGVLSVVRCGDSPVPGPEDLALVTELVGRTAAPLARAMAATRERTTALALQEALLPQGPAGIPGIAATGRYVAGTDGLAVGGDWWDVLDLGAGRVGFAIGDVMGRGLQAAGVMGQLRSAVRAWAQVDLPPADTLVLLDGLVAELSHDGVDTPLVTACYGVLDVATGALEVANAGHLPPLVVTPGKGARRLEVPAGTVLGLGLGDVGVTRAVLGPDEVLALYTDGLVERRDEDLGHGVDDLGRRLHDLLPDAPPHAAPGARGPALDEAADALIALMRSSRERDDAALLLVSRVLAAPPDLFSLGLEGPGDVERARAGARALLAGREVPRGAVDDVLLVLSELAGNALRHGAGPYRVDVSLQGDVAVVDVRDTAARLPRRRFAELEDEGGRGLALVGMLSRRWGTRIHPDGKSVWAEVPLTG